MTARLAFDADSFAAARATLAGLDGKDLIAAALAAWPGQVAVVSSFGAESAVLLDLVAQVDPGLPVIVLDTDAHFDETLDYQKLLSAHLGLTGIRLIRPDKDALRAADELWRTDPDHCCHLRKVVPLEQATAGFAVLIDGRKGYHGGERDGMEPVQLGADGRLKISPLARWDGAAIEAAFTDRALPRHPLVAQGYRSIGCYPCSRPSLPGESVRAGRWSGAGKTECGIHKVSRPS